MMHVCARVGTGVMSKSLSIFVGSASASLASAAHRGLNCGIYSLARRIPLAHLRHLFIPLLLIYE